MLRGKEDLFVTPLRVLQADEPLTLVESAIAQIHGVLKRSRARRWQRGAARAEWWAHCRRGADTHQLHFDVNENLLRKGRGAYALRHPVSNAFTALRYPLHHVCHTLDP